MDTPLPLPKYHQIYLVLREQLQEGRFDRDGVPGEHLLADDGETPIGSGFVVDFPDRASAEAFFAEDPYNKAGLFQSVAITPYRKVLP